MKQVALFDVDKTLVAGYCGYYTALRLVRQKVIRKRHLLKAIFYKAISPIYRGNVRKMYEWVLADMEGWPLEKALAIGRQCFEEDIRQRLYVQGIELLESHKRLGHPLYFVTASPYMTIKILGDHLGVCADFAPGPVVKDGVLQREVREPLAYGRGKLDIAKLVAKREGVSLADCYFYSDNIDDIDLLDAVGFPHVVNPDRKLEKVAQKRQWPILRFEEVLGEGDSRE